MGISGNQEDLEYDLEFVATQLRESGAVCPSGKRALERKITLDDFLRASQAVVHRARRAELP